MKSSGLELWEAMIEKDMSGWWGRLIQLEQQRGEALSQT